MLVPLLLAAATLSPVDAWAAKVCPPPKAAGSDVAAYHREERRRDCLRDAMNRELDRVIVPLAKKDRAAKRRWMTVQAEFNRFTKQLCALAEDVAWIDFDTGERTEGSGGGFTGLECEERVLAWRGFYATRDQRGPRALGAFLRSTIDAGARRRGALADRLRKLTRYESTPPAPAAPTAGATVLSKEDWRSLHARIESLVSSISTMADGQCFLARDALAKGCLETMSDAFFSLVRLEWASDEG